MAVILPEEVERHIFELTAQFYPETRDTLLLVAKYVSPWIAAITYGIVVVGVGRRSGSVTSEPSRAQIKRYGVYIRHLLLGIGCTRGEFEVYLRSCPNIVNLCVWPKYRFLEETLAILKQLPLIRISIPIGSLYNSALTFPDQTNQLRQGLACFPQVTHVDFATGLPLRFYPCVQYLPSLTYLTIFNDDMRRDNEAWGDAFTEIFELCPRLKLIVPLSKVDTSEDYGVNDEDHGVGWDRRVVSCTVKNHVDDWIRGALGEQDLWVFASKQVETRKDPKSS